MPSSASPRCSRAPRWTNVSPRSTHYGTVAEAREALLAGNVEAASALAHKLKGLAANLGFVAVAECAATVERRFADPLTREPPDALLTALQAALDAAMSDADTGFRMQAAHEDAATEFAEVDLPPLTSALRALDGELGSFDLSAVKHGAGARRGALACGASPGCTPDP